MNRITNTRYTGRPYYTPETTAVEKLLGMVQLYLSPLALSVEVFLHWRSFGREYITRFRLMTAFVLMQLVHLLWCYGIQFTVIKWHVGILPIHGRSAWLLWYSALFLGLALWHRITCIREVSGYFFDRGIYWGCWSWFGISDHWVYCWIEPLCVLSLAAWLPQPLKGWLIVASVAMFLKYQIEELEHSLSEKKYVITRTGVDEIHTIAAQGRQQKKQVRHTAAPQPSHLHYPTKEMAYDNLDPTYHDMMNRKET